MQNSSRTRTVGIVAAIVVIAAIAVIAVNVYRHMPKPVPWKTYTQEAYGFTVSYPSNWIVIDQLSTSTTCCLFVDHWMQTASGTQELMKIQFGPYTRAVKDDPFASTTVVTLNGKEFHMGVAGPALQFYMLPRTDMTGIGAGVFSFIETPAGDRDIAKKVVGSVEFVATTTATTTSKK